jgi:RND family efflux transporter MFP subunit
MAYTCEVGQHVHAGDVLVKLGAAELGFASLAAAASATQARARIGDAASAENLPSSLAARAELEVAADAKRRAEELFGQGSLSEQELSRVRANASAAKARYDDALAGAQGQFVRVQELEAASMQAQAALYDKTVRAPFDGVVLDRFIELGQLAAPNAPLIRVIDPSELRVRFDVPQFDADKVALGRRVTVQVEQQLLTGSVVRSTPGLIGAANARLVEAKLALPDPAGDALEPRILPGARFATWLEIGGEDQVVQVPRASTTTTAGLLRAWVIDENRLSERLLSVLRFEGDQVLVRGGLQPGDLVVRTPEPDFRLGEEVAR